MTSRQHLHQLRFPERHRARLYIHRAVKAGKIIRPTVCGRCKAVVRIQAHHYKGYDRKYWTEVIWLCPECHRTEHKMSRPKHPTAQIRVDAGLYEIVKLKAQQNRRSIVKELEILIEEACEYERESHERAQRELQRRRR